VSLDQVRAIADAVLYEGYLLYPYRASSRKNQSRWQFGVLGPPHASAASFGEPPTMSMQCLLTQHPDEQPDEQSVTVHLRFLQLQRRSVERYDGRGYVPTDELSVGGRSMLSWDEAVEREMTLAAYSLVDGSVQEVVLDVQGGVDIEDITTADGPAGRIVRRREPLVARVRTSSAPDDGHIRLSVEVSNAHPDPAEGKDDAIRASLIGAHLVLEARGAGFVSLLEPPPAAAEAAARCHQARCWPVLAGAPGSSDVLLGSPIILYDYPEVAPESAGALFDSTEIDEILTLRVMTMTEEEKAEARATDPRAREIIDRCDQMTPETLQQLHGVLRDPAPSSGDVRNAEPPDFDTGDVPWWDPSVDEAVQPEVDSVMIEGVRVSRDSLVKLHPSRRADAHDMFFADQVARVTAVLSDVDGGTHIAVVLVDDPAADLHDWFGRFFYFAPDEIEPLDRTVAQREESRP